MIADTLPLLTIQPSLVRSEILTELYLEKIVVSVDRNQMQQALFNLVKNAIEASGEGAPVIIKTDVIDGAAVISIIDNGCGMSQDVINNIFEPFFSTKRPGKNAGLGMVISKAIVDNHNGRILIESEVGKGTTMRIVLPIQTG